MLYIARNRVSSNRITNDARTVKKPGFWGVLYKLGKAVNFLVGCRTRTGFSGCSTLDVPQFISTPVASELILFTVRTRQCRVPTPLIVGTRHCRVLYIIPMQPQTILLTFFCNFLYINRRFLERTIITRIEFRYFLAV